MSDMKKGALGKLEDTITFDVLPCDFEGDFGPDKCAISKACNRVFGMPSEWAKMHIGIGTIVFGWSGPWELYRMPDYWHKDYIADKKSGRGFRLTISKSSANCRRSEIPQGATLVTNVKEEELIHV